MAAQILGDDVDTMTSACDGVIEWPTTPFLHR